MPLFVYIGHDGPRGAELRKTVREQHLAHIAALDAEARVTFAGPLRGDDGAPCGSVVIVEATDLAAARAIAEHDPYLVQGVFERVDVHETMQVFPKSGD